jgi:hypothetical protein
MSHDYLNVWPERAALLGVLTPGTSLTVGSFEFYPWRCDGGSHPRAWDGQASTRISLRKPCTMEISSTQRGFAIILDPADPDTAAEFVTWYLRQLPAFDPEVRLITDDFEVSMPLAPQTTAAEVEAFLRLQR